MSETIAFDSLSLAPGATIATVVEDGFTLSAIGQGGLPQPDGLWVSPVDLGGDTYLTAFSTAIPIVLRPVAPGTFGFLGVNVEGYNNGFGLSNTPISVTFSFTGFKIGGVTESFSFTTDAQLGFQTLSHDSTDPLSRIPEFFWSGLTNLEWKVLGTTTGLASFDDIVVEPNRRPVGTDGLTATASEDALFVSGQLTATDADFGQTATLTYSGASLPPGVEVDADGKFRVFTVPGDQNLAVGQSRVVTFQYTATDGTMTSAPKTVTATITGANDGPTARADTFNVGEDDGDVVLHVLANDTDPDAGDTRTLVSVGPIAHGALSLVDGKVAYTPGAYFQNLGAGQTVEETFSYTMRDAAGATSTATATVTITGVNDDPTAHPDSFTIDENANALIDVLANDTDPDANNQFEIVDVSATTRGGTVEVVDGKIRYSANAESFDLLGAGQSIVDSFTYTSIDSGGVERTSTVNVTVRGVADGGAVVGTRYKDTLDGTALDERIEGKDGNDILSGFDGADRLLGDDGDDQLFGGLGRDLIYGGEDDDTLDGEDGDDTLNGGSGADQITGGLGDDLLNGYGRNNDSPDRHPHDHSGSHGYEIGGGHDSDKSAHDHEWDDDDDDHDDDDGHRDDGDVLDGQDGNDTLIGAGGDDILLAGVGDDRAYGGDEDDVLLGMDGNDTLDGGDDEDEVIGGGGDDQLFGSDGHDTLMGDEGADTLAGGDDKDSLSGGFDNDSLSGGEGYDTLAGDEGNDTLSGGDDKDLLNGGADNDRLTGDAGDDKLNGDAGDDALDGGADKDTLSGGIGLDLLSGGAGDDRLLGDAGNDVLNGGTGKDYLSGGFDFDLLNGDADDDVLYGDDGNDTLNGGTGKDELFGGAGHDRLVGGDGVHDDELTGGAGNDVLVGGLGEDTFIFTSGFGKDVISDFDTRYDEIKFSKTLFTSYSKVMAAAQQVGADVVITFDANNSLTLTNVLKTALKSDDFIFGG